MTNVELEPAEVVRRSSAAWTGTGSADGPSMLEIQEPRDVPLGGLPGVAERLAGGGRVADIGCGHGVAAILLANAYPLGERVRLQLPAAIAMVGPIRVVPTSV